MGLMERDIKYCLNPLAWAQEILNFQVDDIQRQIFDLNNKRIIINCHRQWGKSTISSLLCFHQALYHPKSLCLLVAPSLRQSSENFRKINDALEVISSADLDEDTKLSLKLNNGSRIISLPGTQKTVRGFSAPDLIILDESAQAEDELFYALFPMLASKPTSRIVLASTPWGQRGFFYKIWTEGGLEWLKIKVKGSDNPRIQLEQLEEARQSLGEFMYSQEFDCEFVASETQLFGLDSIRRALDPSIEIISFESEV